jgi:uncharacterized damage-inducible protein DinB
MLTETLIEIFDRDLNKLIEEIKLYKEESNLWMVKDGISNSAGNLSLHLVGNLNHFIGATLGNTGYIRHRDDEFALKDIPREDIITAVENTIGIVTHTLLQLTADDLAKDFPLPLNGRTLSTMHMLVHLLAHLSYHLGQINYHRRLTSN